MNYIKENIENLTSLWRLAGDQSGINFQKTGYEFSWIPGSDWPNRLWFTNPINSNGYSSAIEQAKMHNLGISIWDGIEITNVMLESEGFIIKSELTGMTLSLENLNSKSKTLEMEPVSNFLEASEWSSLFQEAFGYKIDSYTILKISNVVNFYIARHNQEAVGTAVLFQNKPEVAGIHSMGIIPSMRRKGYAEEMLLTVLEAGKEKGARLATLQASEMGKGLYLKTGFQEQFKFKTYNYKIQNNNESNRELKMAIRH